jgi:hypothetical protein
MLEETRDVGNSSVAQAGEMGVLKQLNNLDLDVTLNKDKVCVSLCCVIFTINIS